MFYGPIVVTTTGPRSSGWKRALSLALGAASFWIVGFLAMDALLTNGWTITGAHSQSARVSIGVLMAVMSAACAGLSVFVYGFVAQSRALAVPETGLPSLIASVAAAVLPWKPSQHPFILLLFPMAVLLIALGSINTRRGGVVRGASQ